VLVEYSSIVYASKEEEHPRVNKKEPGICFSRTLAW